VETPTGQDHIFMSDPYRRLTGSGLVQKLNFAVYLKNSGLYARA